MRIRAKNESDFLDGRFRFRAGQGYDVPDRRGGVYLASGWAAEAADDDPGPFEAVALEQLTAEAPAPAQDGATLQVQAAGHGARTNVGG